MIWALDIATHMARAGLDDKRTYALGAVGKRSDGAWVHARNGSSERVQPLAHAERRLLRKLDKGSIIYVARARSGGGMALARPCERCLRAMKVRGVKKVYYTIADNEYGVIAL